METNGTDPIDWGVDEVVAFLCNPKSAPWAQSVTSARPDPAALETALRDNFISGEVLLHDVDSDAIKNDLGVNPLGHRSSVTRAIEWLRLRSSKYQMAKKSQIVADELLKTSQGSLSPHASTPVFTPLNLATTLSPTAPNPQAQPTRLPSKRRIAPTLVSSPEELNNRQVATKLPGDQAQAVGPSLSAPTSTGSANITSADLGRGKHATAAAMGGNEMSSTLSLNRGWFTTKLEAELLQKYPPGDDEEPLPLYGESGSENDYDSQGWRELLNERPHLAQAGSSSPQAPSSLSREVLETLISQYINEQGEIWKNESLPKELPFARPLWERSREGNNLDQIKEEITARLSKDNKYLGKLKRGILDTHYRSEARVLRSCSALDQTLSRIFLERWRLSVLEMKECPPETELPPRPRRPSKKRHGSIDSAESELSEDLGSSSETNWVADDDDIDDFIIEDDANDEPEAHSQETSQGLPFALATSESGDDEDTSDSSSDFPARKKRRVTQHGQGEDEDDGIQSLNPTAPQLEPTLDSGLLRPLPSVDQGTPITTQETGDADEMDIETPPLNPMYWETPEDADVTHAGLSSGPVDQAPDLPSSNTALRGNSPAEDGSQRVPASSETHANTTGTTGPAASLEDDVELFTMLTNVTTKSIETQKNRIHLLAKIVMSLTAHEIELFPTFLTRYITTLYKEYVQEALQAMLNNDRQLEGRDPDESLLAMRMSAMFVSWYHCIALQPTASHRRFIQESLEALEDGVNNFPSFFERLKSLVEAVQVWAFSEQSRRLYENQIEAQSCDPSSTKKRGNGSRPLTTLQREAHDRQVRQDKLREKLRCQQEKEGRSNHDPAGQMVTFKEPIIYLHPHIGQFVKPHQLMGIQFLWRELVEAKKSQGCMLAHVMGLGKTMQVISFLATVAAASISPVPEIRMAIPTKFRRARILIVCPSPLIDNWLDELAIWLPEDHNVGPIRYILSRHRSSDVSRIQTIQDWIDECGILILSYEMLRLLVQTRNATHEMDEEHMRIREWLLDGPNIIVADEAHRLRNKDTAISQIANSFKSKSRIALTGSPLANHLSEYYHMVEWVAPGYLGDRDLFKLRFIDPIQDGLYMDSTVAQQRESLIALKLLNGIIGPKVLRADASVIASDLPPKTEFVLSVPLTELQQKAYNIFVSSLTSADYAGSASYLWSWLALIQLCDNHPFPFREKLADRYTQAENPEATGDAGIAPLLPRTIKEAGLPSDLLPRIEDLFGSVPNLENLKLSNRTLLLTQILNESINAGDKVLVFTQSIPTMDFLCQTLQQTGHRFARIDGRTPSYDRQDICKRFNSTDNEDILLISTRAGGLGLNMFGANRVVIFDFLFNPTWEEQAVGRAYRLGQQKPVFVYRLIASGTFEDIIFSNASYKSQLAVRVVDKKNVIRESAKQSTRYLFPVKQREKEDCTAIMGKDPLVLDRILTGMYAHTIFKASVSQIRDNEHDRLTALEHRLVKEQLELELLKRTDPQKYEAELERRQTAEIEKQKRQQELGELGLGSMTQVQQQGFQASSTSLFQYPRAVPQPNIPQNQNTDGQMEFRPKVPMQQESAPSASSAPNATSVQPAPTLPVTSASLVSSMPHAHSTDETPTSGTPVDAPSPASVSMDISEGEEPQPPASGVGGS